MFGKKKAATNYDKLRKIREEDTIRNRNVYEEQQIERSKIGEKKTMTSRIVIVSIIAAIVCVVVWVFLSVCQGLFAGASEMFQGVQSGTPSTIVQVDWMRESPGQSRRAQYLGSYGFLSAGVGGVEIGEEIMPELDAGASADTSVGPTAEEFWRMYHEEITYENFVKKFFQVPVDGSSGFDGRYNGLRYTRLSLFDIYSAITYDMSWPAYAALFDPNQESIDAYMDKDPAEGRPEDTYLAQDPSGETGSNSWVNLDDLGVSTNPGDGQGSGQIQGESNPGSWVDVPGTQGDGQNPGGSVNPGVSPGVSDPEPDVSATGGINFGYYLKDFALWKIFWTLVITALAWLFGYTMMKKNLEAQNQLEAVDELNQYTNDQHIQFPQEMMAKYDWFPDVGAHSPVAVSSMIGHVMLTKKGLKNIDVARRATKDIMGPDGEVEYLEGEVLLDADGMTVYDSMPIIDEKFADKLYDSADVADSPKIRLRFNAGDILYNPGDKNKDKQPGAETVADMINKYWTFPEYEPQRPAGAYLVDTAPANTMVLAITRAGKGQTYIEPTLDMWTRENRPSNMVVNDPKGELLVKFYVKGTVRGYQIVQFNLINPLKTDIYNPLGLAADAAREGDFTKCAAYVENIAAVFFPISGSEDPLWPNAANNA